uniref:Uncharacterized protein n=1 Tax=Zea mays TaxID=4577 RepID=C0PLC6_MAIZE|nr:unknown [Zea mays]
MIRLPTRSTACQRWSARFWCRKGEGGSGEDLDGLRDGEGEHRGDERAVGEHGQVGERGRARRRGGGAGDDGFRHGLTIGHARLWEWKGPPASA